MDVIEKDEYNELKDNGTGSHDTFDDYKAIIYPFNKYEIKVILTMDNEFVGITEVKINKNFLSYKEKQAIMGYHNVEEFYQE